MAAGLRSMTQADIVNYPSVMSQNEKINAIYRVTVHKHTALLATLKRYRDINSDTTLRYIEKAHDNVHNTQDVFCDFMEQCYEWAEGPIYKTSPAFLEG